MKILSFVAYFSFFNELYDGSIDPDSPELDSYFEQLWNMEPA
jgi:hypothetical protein